MLEVTLLDSAFVATTESTHERGVWADLGDALHGIHIVLFVAAGTLVA
jgi:hypothetical protein